jgi:hypothetical protein
MSNATLTKVANQIIIRTPYNASLVDEIKSLPGRRWNDDIKAWSVPAEHETSVREIVRQYFQIEGEESQVKYEVLELIVWADNTYKRSYPHGVTIDGCDVVNMAYGSIVQRSNTFELLESSGGFICGDSNHAFEVKYQIKVRVRKDATIETYGRCGQGQFKILNKVKV